LPQLCSAPGSLWKRSQIKEKAGDFLLVGDLVARVKSFRWRRGIYIVVGLAVLITVAVGLRDLNGNASPATNAAPSAVPVTAAIAKQTEVPQIINAIGTVQSIDSVGVQPRVTGAIMKVEFTPGQDVTQGQELFLIDPRPYQAALDQAKAQLAHDEGLLEEAQMDLVRYQTLAKQKAIAKQQAQDQVYVVKQDQGTVQIDQANVETAELNLQYCHVAAPIAGRAGALLIDLGNLVGPQIGGQATATATTTGSSATYGQSTAGNSLVSITQVRPIYVSFNVPQTMLGKILRKSPAGALEVDAYSQAGKLLGKGKVTLIDNQVNTSTGTILLQATFANTHETLWPGEFVTVKLIVGMRQNVVTVPAQAVMAGPNSAYVYVIGADDKVRRVDIKVAARQDGIAVIKNGISTGDQVVTNGQYRLADSVQVAVRKTTASG
jgi:membrane fusion protein, multidrug efflux system